MLVAWAVVLVAHPGGDVRADAGAIASAADPVDERVPEDVTDDAGIYYTQLDMMLAHMHLGEELYRLGAGEDARAHLVTPATDYLPNLSAVLQERGLERVAGRIDALADAARGSDSWLDLQTPYEATRMSIERARVEVDASLREDPGFQAQVLLAVARRAVDEYEAAVADGAVADDSAYRASYGFAQQGRRILRRNEGLFSLPGRDLHEELVARHEHLLEAWPSLRPPRGDAVPVSEARERLDAIAAVARRY